MLMTPPPERPRGTVKDGDYVTVAGHGGDGCAKYSVWQRAMGIFWMTKEELTEAVPPAYSEYLGDQLFREVERRARAA